MKQYTQLSDTWLIEDNYSIIPIQESHIESIRQWRNAQLSILRQKSEISPSEQRNYFEKNIWPNMLAAEPENILLSYLEHGELIGYGGLVHINWHDRRAEVSFLLDPKRAENNLTYAEEFKKFLAMLKKIAFDRLELHRLFTETFDIRPVHIKALEQAGFIAEGVLREHVRVDGKPVNSIIHGCLSNDER